MKITLYYINYHDEEYNEDIDEYQDPKPTIKIFKSKKSFETYLHKLMYTIVEVCCLDQPAEVLKDAILNNVYNKKQFEHYGEIACKRYFNDCNCIDLIIKYED